MITVPILLFLLKTLGINDDNIDLMEYNKAITFSYYGHNFQPGGKIGYEYTVLSFDRQSDIDQKYQCINKQFFAAHNLGLFYGNSASNLFLNTQVGYRYTSTNGNRIEGMAGAGYLIMLPLLKPYEDENGEMVKTSVFKQSRIYPSIAIGFGKDFSKKYDLPLAINIRPTLSFKYPHENRIKTFFMLEGGIAYYLK
jgi:hypothetical protein